MKKKQTYDKESRYICTLYLPDTYGESAAPARAYNTKVKIKKSLLFFQIVCTTFSTPS